MAASSGGCSGSRHARWATGSPSSTRTRTARLPRWPTRSILGTYDDVGAALRLGEISDVVTYELEHVAAAVVDALEPVVPVRPGRLPLVATQDRLAERRFVEAAGIGVAPWREVRTAAELRAAADPAALGLPLRLKVVIGGYDGRGQVRLADDGRHR